MAKKVKITKEYIKNNIPVKDSKGKIIAIIILSTVILILFIVLIALADENNSLESQNEYLIETNGELWDEIEFYDEKVVFQIQGYGNYYYSYDCMMELVGNEKYYFWAYNKEAAIEKGLKEGSC